MATARDHPHAGRRGRSDPANGTQSASGGSPTERSFKAFPPAPIAPDGPLEGAVGLALDTLATSLLEGGFDVPVLGTIAATKDARLAWFVSDLLRFLQGTDRQDALVTTFAARPWQRVTDPLIAWDLPEPSGYRDLKSRLFTRVEPGWRPFLDDADAAIDWRLVSCGCVLIDDRPLGDARPCERGYIPALDDPAWTSAAEGEWYLSRSGRLRNRRRRGCGGAPKEHHGGARVGQYDQRRTAPWHPVLHPVPVRAGLLHRLGPLSHRGARAPHLGLPSRSNKVMYDPTTNSVFDTFTGVALSGPLQDARVTLEQDTVVVTTWGAWKAAYPATRFVAQDGGISRAYPAAPLDGRNDYGPIFPIGDMDPRLPARTNVVKVIGLDGRPLAFPADQARATLADGGEVVVGDVEVAIDGGGLRARVRGGRDLPAHRAFWFAWSRSNRETVVWSPLTP